MAELTLRDMAAMGRKKSRWAASYTEIANVFTKHVHYVRGNDEARSFAQLWSRRADIAYMVGEAVYRGQAAVEAVFVTARETQRKKDLPVMAENFSELGVQETEDYLGFGDYEFHSLVNPYIQIAGDDGTAKAVWWSPGLVSHMDARDKQSHAYFAAMIYAVDLIHEADGWKIWHLREMDEFAFDLPPGILNDMSFMALHAPAPSEDGELTHPGPPKFTKEEIAVMMVRGQKVPGRSGENLRILHGMPSADPPMDPIPGATGDMMFVNDGMPGVRRTFADVVGDYETFTPEVGVVRHLAGLLEDFLKFEP